MYRFFFICISLLTTGCFEFPYGEEIQKNKEFIEKNEAAAFSSIKTPQGKLHYIYLPNLDKDKAFLVFIHGSPGDWAAFAGFLKNQDLQKDFHLMAVDRPGFGGSDAGKAQGSLQIQTDQVMAAVKKHHRGQKLILVGHSYGGPVVARTAMDYPEVSSIVIVAGSVDPELEETKWFQYPAQWPFLRWLVPNDLDVSNQEILALKQELQDQDSKWAKIRQVVHLIHGEKDDLVPVENVEYAEKKLVNASEVKKIIRKDMNHFVPWSNPELIINSVLELKQK